MIWRNVQGDATDFPDSAHALAVHPADVDLPWIKAEAAQRGVDVVASPNVKRGECYLIAAALRCDYQTCQQDCECWCHDDPEWDMP